MSAEQLASLAGILLSLLFSYVPGLSGWYAALSGEYKRLVMFGLLVLTGAGAYGLSCSGWGSDLVPELSCNQSSLVGLVMVIVRAAIANQAAYLLSPQLSKSEQG